MLYTKRPAVVLAISYFGALGICHLLLHFALSLWLLIVYAALFLFIYCVLFDGKRHLLLSVAIVATILFAALQFRTEVKARTAWEDLRGETVSVRGVIEELSYTSDNISYMTAHISEVNGEKTSVRLSLSVTGGLHLAKFESFSGKVRVLTKEEVGAYSEQNESYYRAKGIVGEAELQSDELSRLGTPFSLRAVFASLRTTLCDSLSHHIPYEELTFLRGMVFGDRDAISPTVARDFRRTGTSHMLAVSGTHLSILITALCYLCGKLHIGRAPSIVLLVIVAVFVTAITGFSLSVLRAALMWGIGALAYVFGGKRDGYSALALAAMLICACDIRAVYDIGLQMSVLSTLGILVLGAPTDKWLVSHLPHGRFFDLVRSYALMPALLTLSSTIFTLPVTLVSIGEISLVAPLANMLLALPTTVLLAATPILLLLICLPIQLPAYLLALCISAVTRLTLWSTRLLSTLPDTLVGIGYPFTVAVTVITCAIAYLLYRRKKNVLVLYTAFLVGTLLFSACHGIYQYICRDRVTVIYQMQGKNESLGVIKEGKALLIDISNGANAAAYNAWSALGDRQITEIEALVLTHYDRKHDAMLSALCERTVVRSIYLPKPVTEKDAEIYAMIRASDYTRDIPCYEYDASIQELHFADVRISFLENAYLSRSEVPLTAFSLDVGEECLSYISASAWEAQSPELQTLLGDTEYLICGNHGPVIKAAYGMREGTMPYRFVSVPTCEAAQLFSHSAEQSAVAEETEYIEIHLTTSGE